ncbi:unnamed protein product [Meganyctiphanes norvegica]|uniref:Glycosyltransferase family 92 protein n=1 Tax=Meganyctiphanes norvegica TaxID=48144 RepID=A0AAV2Q209_MEGNR
MSLVRWCPTRAIHRGLYLIVLWSSLCYLIFRFSGQDDTASFVNSNTKFVPLEAEPLIDRKPTPSELDLANQIQKNVPNLPIIYWQKYRGKLMKMNRTCAKFPSLYDINYNNMYWQILKSSNWSFYLYGAYYDNRTLVAMKPVIRILGMNDRLDQKVKIYCQLWFEGHTQPVFSQVFEYNLMWYKRWGDYTKGTFKPYMIACQIPPGYKHLVPESVSLVEKPCDMAKTNLRVINNRPEHGKKEDFAVCVKGLDFLHDDLSVRLVEWLELLFLVGANKVFFYQLEVHHNISKVLNYYQNQGKVEVTPITLPGEQPNIPGLLHMYLKSKLTNKRLNELIPYNDCLYKNIYRYKYIVLLDTDEIIMPKGVMNWKELMDTVIIPKALQTKKTLQASYNVRNVYFMDNMKYSQDWYIKIPNYMHMLQHVSRSVNYTKPRQYVKCFHDPEQVLTLHNHFPLSCLGGNCTTYDIETADAHLQHYRTDCVKTLKRSCDKEFRNNTIIDTTIWKYRDLLISQVTKVLVRLDFFNPRRGN